MYSASLLTFKRNGFLRFNNTIVDHNKQLEDLYQIG